MISANIFKSPMFAGCAGGGISETHEQVCIVNAKGPNKEPHASEAPVILVRRDVMGRSLLTFYPAVKDRTGMWVKDPRWLAFGGSFVFTSDERLDALCKELGVSNHGAIKLHDRYEGYQG